MSTCTIDDVKARQRALKSNIGTLITQFQKDTGCTPLIDVDYRTLGSISEPTRQIPVVEVRVVITP